VFLICFILFSFLWILFDCTISGNGSGKANWEGLRLLLVRIDLLEKHKNILEAYDKGIRARLFNS
jgi:hypothetical protein